MEYYMDEKWKLSKDDKNTSLSRSVSQKCSTKSPLLRSLTKKNSFNLSRSSSQKSCTSSNKSSMSRSSSQRCAEFTRKCSSLAKEQKAKLYIVKRCITMLVCWKKHGDS
ncbi:ROTUNDIFOLIA like 5 [Abeliophyllum distichum]|uniref:ROTUNDIFOLIA like 5 n=1 Tax=Abeliophyllum distichum TaxID=126358 RepID=A0ABD1RDG0_9LAMI